MEVGAGGEPFPLTRDEALDDAADFAPDGRSLAFVSTRDGDADIFTMPFDPDDPTAEERATNLTRRPGGDFHPAFSPDGRPIAYSRPIGRPRVQATPITKPKSPPADGPGQHTTPRHGLCIRSSGCTWSGRAAPRGSAGPWRPQKRGRPAERAGLLMLRLSRS